MKCVEFLGCGMSRGDIPPFNPAAERWGLNKLMFMRYGGEFDEWTRWFDLHSSAHIEKRRPEAYRWYAEQTKPIYRWETDSSHVTAVYPREEVQMFFAQDGVPERDFAGSFAWMMALAIMEGFEQIDVFWMPLDTECHQAQLATNRYWIGQARGRGIRVRIHGDSAMTPSGPLYGLETT